MASNLVTLLFLEEHRSKRSRPLCETEWNDREASRRKSIFCSSSRMCKGIRGTRGWKIDGTTWNSFDFDCFRRTFNATAAKVEPRFLLRRKRLLSLLFIYFFPLPFFSYGEKYNNYIVSLNRCWTSESFSFSRRKGIIIVFFLLFRWKFSILFPYFLLLSLSPHFSKKEISWQLRYVRINRGKYPGEQRVYI